MTIHEDVDRLKFQVKWLMDRIRVPKFKGGDEIEVNGERYFVLGDSLPKEITYYCVKNIGDTNVVGFDEEEITMWNDKV